LKIELSDEAIRAVHQLIGVTIEVIDNSSFTLAQASKAMNLKQQLELFKNEIAKYEIK